MDGAMGTLLYERGQFVSVCYEELSVTRPDLVGGIHREYLEAGAEILTTHTFGANPVKLSGFGLMDRTEAINRTAAELAREVSAGAVPVLGTVGPLGLGLGDGSATAFPEAQSYFRRQVEGLVEGGVDGFALETFSDLTELRLALSVTRSQSDKPVFAQLTFPDWGYPWSGTSPEDAARELADSGADVIGVNCSPGPLEALEVIEQMAPATTLPLIAQPNAGLGQVVGDRRISVASPAHFAAYAKRIVESGGRFVGGCCGTTPAHVRAIRAVLNSTLGEARRVVG
jgi:methionine synthase I (cobalamin-dependent)